jgi:hypothetical protein
MPSVKGAPYEARIVVQGMSSGLPMEQTPLQARDGAGRMRTETLQMRLGQDGKPITVREVEADDVVSHCGFHWIEPWVDKSVPTATVSCMPRTLHYNSQPMWASVVSMKAAEEHPSSTETDRNEPLGVRTFDGMRAVGVRHTRILQPTTPENAQTTVTELWVSTEMKEVVAMYQDFPGGFRMELRDIKLREPDAGMFYPPANYKIIPVSNSALSHWLQTTLATAGMRRRAADVSQLRPSAPQKTIANFAYPGSDAGSSAYCSQLTKA